MKWKKYLLHGGVLTVVFVLAVFGFSFITNKDNSSMVSDVEAASRPEIAFSCEGYTVNVLPAYKNQMDIPAVRDTITPVTNGKLEVKLRAYENVIEEVSYMVYTLDGEETLLENTLKKPGESFTLELGGEKVLAEERVLEVILTTSEKDDLHFYTRLLDSQKTNTRQCLDYMSRFHEGALQKAEGVGIGTAIEPSDEGDNTTLQHVTIHSDYDHVTWGDLEPEVDGNEYWSIKEMNSTYTSLLMEYRVRCKGEENDEDVYAVREFFRVRYSKDTKKTYLLDYDRTMEQVFDASHRVLSEKGILLGIADRDVPYLVNGDGTVVSFVQARELWNYNKNTDEMSLVFSFADAESSNERNIFAQHEVQLLNMDKTGNTVFAVYGYMNRGEHEGEVGVSVYYYDIGKNSVDEKIFIPTDKSYERAVFGLGHLLYYNEEENLLYALVNETLYEVDVDKEWGKELVTDLKDDGYVTSDDSRFIAYEEKADDESTARIIVRDFAKGTEREITCGEDEIIQPLGFMNTDFVYGLSKNSDAGQTVSGQEITPMYKIEIENTGGKPVKTYEQKGVYVLEAVFDDKMITLDRVKKKGNTYTSTKEDYITSNTQEEESNIYVETYTTELKERQVRITYADGIADKEPKQLKPKQAASGKAATISFKEQTVPDKCYVYVYGKLHGIYDNAGEAIREADEWKGIVVSARQTYIWVSGNRDLSYSIDGKDAEIETIRAQLKAGKTPVEIMDAVSDGKAVDLTGCTTEQLLYVVNQDVPVIAMQNTKHAVILTGYGQKTVTYVDADSGKEKSVSYARMDKMTQGSGNTYVGYIQ